MCFFFFQWSHRRFSPVQFDSVLRAVQRVLCSLCAKKQAHVFLVFTRWVQRSITIPCFATMGPWPYPALPQSWSCQTPKVIDPSVMIKTVVVLCNSINKLLVDGPVLSIMVHKQLVRIRLGVDRPLTKATCWLTGQGKKITLPKLGYQSLKREFFVMSELYWFCFTRYRVQYEWKLLLPCWAMSEAEKAPPEVLLMLLTCPSS